MPTVDIQGHRLDYRQTPGAAEGAPTLVFLHEGLGSQEQWRDFPDRLTAATGCGALAYSRWGYGRSDARPAPWPATYLEDEGAETLPALLAACAITQAILFGHSDGGTIALVCAARQPALVRGVVTEAAHVLIEDVTVSGVEQARGRFQSETFRQGLARYHGDNTLSMFEGWSGVWLEPSARSWDIRPMLPDVTCPVLAMQGDTDEFGTARQLDDIASRVSGPVETWLIGSCGHTPHRERPDEVAARVVRFINGLPGL